MSWDGKAATPAQRTHLLNQYFIAQRTLRDLRRAAETADPETRVTQLLRASTALVEVQEKYRSAVPVRALSRCPFTHQVLTIAIDDGGIDGPWWDYEAGIRPADHTLPTFFALTGALTIDRNVPLAPFVCRPGPEVPFVVPRMLEHPAVRAVVSSLTIGELTGYVICYFAEPIPHDLARYNTWGMDRYTFTAADGSLMWADHYEYAGELDFDLEAWLRRGRLAWVAPGDETFELRDSFDDCPYVGLNGRRVLLNIHNGRVWT